MYRKSSKSWAERVDSGGKYLTGDGQWWDADKDTVLAIKSRERPNRQSEQGRFLEKLTDEQVVEYLVDLGYKKRN